METVSIIIPTYNRVKWLGEAIESCLNQKHASIEVIVIDDGSKLPDAKTVVDKYPQVKYFYQENTGLGGARNTGLQRCQGEFVQFLDDDDTLTENSISEKILVFHQRTDIDVVYSDLFVMSEDGSSLSRYYQGRKRPLPEGEIYKDLLSYNFIPVHAILWRKNSLMRVGGFPSRSMLEDWECLIKVSEHSQFAYIDKPLGSYRLHNQNMISHFDKQVQAFAETQKRIVYSQNFNQVEVRYKAYILCKYSLKQWIDGDQELAKEFLREAKKIRPFQLLPWLLSGFMLLGQSRNRWMVRKVWMMRSQLVKGFSTRDYFLKKAGIIQNPSKKGSFSFRK